MDYAAAHQHIEEALASFSQSPRLSLSTNPEVRAIQQVVAARLYDQGLTVRSVMEEAGFRDHNAQTRFHDVMGETIWQYTTRLRIEAAMHLLDATDCPAYLIGQAVGYSGAETFDRAFKGRRGLTPIRYRRATPRRRAAAQARGAVADESSIQEVGETPTV